MGIVWVMSVRWYSVVIDCHDVTAQSRWWARVLDWQVIYEAADEVVQRVLGHPAAAEAGAGA